MRRRGQLRPTSEPVPAATVLIALAYALPYFFWDGVWWRFIPSTAVIVAATAVVNPSDFKRRLGIALTWRDAAESLALLVLALPACAWVLSGVAADASLAVERSLALRWQVHQFFQVLNDELVLRALLLNLALRAFAAPALIVLGASGLFALVHGLLYGLFGVEISGTALVTLFSFGVVANALFVRFRHIGYGLALHYAWSFFRFNARYVGESGRLSEGQTFNYLEGNAAVCAGSILVASVVFAALLRSLERSSCSIDA